MKKVLLLSMMVFAFMANINAAVLVVDDLAAKNAGDPLTGWSKNGAGKVTVTVADDPSGGTKGNCAHIVTTDYDSFWVLTVTLPAGKTIADYGALKYDQYSVVQEYKPTNIYIDGVQFYVDAGYPDQGAPNTWAPKTYSLEGATAGSTTFDLAFGMSHDAGDYYITNVRLEEVVPASAFFVIDFEDYTLGDPVPVFEKNGAGTANATIVEDPAAAGTRGLCAHITTTNYDAFIQLTITLPSGRTLANYEEISYDQYCVAQEYKQTNIYIDGVQFYVDAGYPSQGAPSTWVTKTYSLEGATSGNTFDLAFGMTHDAGNYYIDNIKLKESPVGLKELKLKEEIALYCTGNILYASQPANILIYDLTGQVLKSGKNIPEIDLSNLSSGIYVAKASIAGKPTVKKIVKK